MQTTTLDALPIEFQQFNETVYSLSRLLMQRRLFPSSHPSVEKALSEAFLRVEMFFTFTMWWTLLLLKRKGLEKALQNMF